MNACFIKQTLIFFLRNACSLPDGDTVVVTGGQYTQPEVSRYNENGFVETLPNLVTGRWTHSCSWFINDDRKMVYNIEYLIREYNFGNFI